MAHRLMQEVTTTPSIPEIAAKPWVLVVDDNEDAAHTLTRLLRVLGIDAIAANSGRAAVAEIERDVPALIFLDMRMPDLDGLETAALIRKNQKCSDVILIALTGLSDVEDGVRIRNAGFAALLTKPLQITALEQVLAQYLGFQCDFGNPAPK